MTKEEIQKYYNEFLREYDAEHKDNLWQKQSKEFQEFWKDKILGSAELTEEAMDKIILMLDSKARGAAEFHEAGGDEVATTSIRQGMWYRAFNSIKKGKQLQELLNKIFETTDEVSLIGLVNELKKINEGLGNGLTGSNSNILSAFLFINNPKDYTSWVSLKHRISIIEKFDFGSTEYESWGASVVRSHRQILDGFREKFGVTGSARTVSVFLWAVPPIMTYWGSAYWGPSVEHAEIMKDNIEDGGEVEGQDTSTELTRLDKNSFVLEKHLEDFLVANWESTELGKLYDLIEEDGNMVSQQYQTKEIGNIDLLVREKESGDYVVIELKKGRTSDATVGQLTRYMGWVKKNKANGGKVKGIVIAGSQDERLKYALEMVPDTEFFLYRLTFSLKKLK